MSIMNVYTKEQAVKFLVNKIVSDDVGITAMEDGDAFYSLISAAAELYAMQGLDTLEAIKKAIYVSLYTGMDFRKKDPSKAIGKVRPWRNPAANITYTGSATSAQITISDTQLSIITTAGVDDITVLFSTYPTISDVMAQINAHANYSASAYKGSDASSSMFHYSSLEIVGMKTYQNIAGFDVMLVTDTEINILNPIYFTANGINCQTISDYILPAGYSTLYGIYAESTIARAATISADDLNTFDGKGVISTPISGIDHWVIDDDYSPGTDQETDEDRRNRFAIAIRGSQFNKYGIQSSILELANVRSVEVLNNTPKRGYITAVIDDGSGIISANLQAEVDKVFYGDPNDLVNYPGVLASGVTGYASAPSILGVDINLTVYKLDPNISSTDIQTDVIAAITDHINRLRLGYDVLNSSLYSVARGAHQSVYEVIVNSGATTISSTQVARTGGSYGTVTVSVQLRPES